MSLPENINTLEKAKFLEYLGEVALKVFVVNQQNGTTVKNFGRENILFGQSYVDIIFSTPMLNTAYSLTLGLESSDLNPIFMSYLITSKLTTGARITFNAPADSNNFFLSWQAVEA